MIIISLLLLLLFLFHCSAYNGFASSCSRRLPRTSTAVHLSSPHLRRPHRFGLPFGPLLTCALPSPPPSAGVRLPLFITARMAHPASSWLNFGSFGPALACCSTSLTTFPPAATPSSPPTCRARILTLLSSFTLALAFCHSSFIVFSSLVACHVYATFGFGARTLLPTTGAPDALPSGSFLLYPIKHPSLRASAHASASAHSRHAITSFFSRLLAPRRISSTSPRCTAARLWPFASPSSPLAALRPPSVFVQGAIPPAHPRLWPPRTTFTWFVLCPHYAPYLSFDHDFS